MLYPHILLTKYKGKETSENVLASYSFIPILLAKNKSKETCETVLSQLYFYPFYSMKI